MRLLKYLFPLWAAIFVYSLLSLFYGPSGFSAYEGLMAERDKQMDNIESLKKIRWELEGDRDALLYDGDSIAVQARELGYGTDDERFVRIVGLSKTMRRQYSAGDSIEAQAPESMDEKTIRTVSFITGGVILVFIFFVQILRMLV
ncbi:MAG: septum formation initiator family protein [Spirochaetaceae bacterium]|nr:septum formation initiator family protein [Spirochaetaceae bacterium]